MIINVPQRKWTEARRQWIVFAIVRDAQRALKLYGQARSKGQFGKADGQRVVSEFDHIIPFSSPVAVAHFAHEAKDSVVWLVFQFTDELSKEPWTFADNLLQIAGDFAGHGEQEIRVFA